MNLKEFHGIARCLGLHLNFEQVTITDQSVDCQAWVPNYGAVTISILLDFMLSDLLATFIFFCRLNWTRCRACHYRTQVYLLLILYYLNNEQASEAAKTVSADSTGHSVSFNEYLKLVSNERKSEPDEDALLNMFKWYKTFWEIKFSYCLNYSGVWIQRKRDIFWRRIWENCWKGKMESRRMMSKKW